MLVPELPTVDSAGGEDLDERLRTRVAELRATEAPFTLPDEAEQVIERALAATTAARTAES